MQYKREVAHRLFSDELREAAILERDDEEYAPQYVQIPSGARVNRVFVVGALIEKDDIGTDSEYWKLVISDPKGTFRAYIGMYQESALNVVENIEVPSFVAMVCKIKANVYNDDVYFNLAPESINVVDDATYDRWVEETEKLTAERWEELNDS